MKKKNWYRLDNAAKIYPPISSNRRGSMFAVSAVLKEDVEGEILDRAANIVLGRFPTFKVKLRRGVFWYYLEENKNKFFVREEPPYFLRYINENQSGEYLFNVFYSGAKITVSMFHALTDGTGAIEFLKALLFEYLSLSGKPIRAVGGLKTIYSPSNSDEQADKYLQVYDKKLAPPPKEIKPYKVNGTPFSHDGTGIIMGKMKVADLKVLAKKYGVSITNFITGLLAYSIYQNFLKDRKTANKTVKVLVPVNMRKIYPTQTVRNFALFARPGHDFAREVSLEECITIFDREIKDGIQKENLDRFLKSNVKAERNLLLKITPLFIKDFAMKLVYSKVGDILHTTTVSNLGIIDLPKSVQQYVDDVVFVLGTAFSSKIATAVCSYNGYINITFSREIVENCLEKHFFNFLTENGVQVEIFSNYWEDGNEAL